MTHSLREAYHFFISEHPESLINYNEYKKICQDGNDMIFNDVLLKGLKFRMGNNLSYMQVKFIERNFNKPVVDWPRTSAEVPKNAEGKYEYLIYHTEPYPMLYWNKTNSKIKNKTAYRLKLVRGKNSTSQKLHTMFKTDNSVFIIFPLTKRFKR